MGELKEVGGKEQMYRLGRSFPHLSQWDVETDACMLIQCVCIACITGDQSI